MTNQKLRAVFLPANALDDRPLTALDTLESLYYLLNWISCRHDCTPLRENAVAERAGLSIQSLESISMKNRFLAKRRYMESKHVDLSYIRPSFARLAPLLEGFLKQLLRGLGRGITPDQSNVLSRDIYLEVTNVFEAECRILPEKS